MLNRIIILTLLMLASCAKPENAPDRANRMSGKSLGETIEENRARLLSMPGVISVQAGDCGQDSCIKVTVQKKTEILMNQLPPMLETWRVDVAEAGN